MPATPSFATISGNVITVQASSDVADTGYSETITVTVVLDSDPSVTDTIDFTIEMGC